MHIRASRRKHHIIYKTTCLITGRYYIGMHSTDDLNDAYLGSGLRLLRSVKKHGAGQHRREILEDLSTRDAASEREKELITDEMRSDPECLNCGPGGLGAVDRPATKDETLAKMSASMKRAWDTGKMTGMRGKKLTPEAIAKCVASTTGLRRTEAQKANLSAGLLEHYSHEENQIKHKARMGREEVSTKKRETMLKLRASETSEARNMRFAKMKESAARSEVRAKISAAYKRPEIKAAHSMAIKTAMARPGVRAKISDAMSKACTIDGVTIFSSQTEMIKALGSGKTGSRSPTFRYLIP